MPWGDGTGPLGLGPMTGRGMGYCTGYPVPGFMNPGFGRGRGFRFWARTTGLPGWYRANIGMPAFGSSWRASRIWPTRWVPAGVPPTYYYPQPIHPTKEQEIQFLENEIKAIENEKKLLDQNLEAIKKRLKELKKQV